MPTKVCIIFTIFTIVESAFVLLVIFGISAPALDRYKHRHDQLLSNCNSVQADICIVTCNNNYTIHTSERCINILRRADVWLTPGDELVPVWSYDSSGFMIFGGMIGILLAMFFLVTVMKNMN